MRCFEPHLYALGETVQNHHFPSPKPDIGFFPDHQTQCGRVGKLTLTVPSSPEATITESVGWNFTLVTTPRKPLSSFLADPFGRLSELALPFLPPRWARSSSRLSTFPSRSRICQQRRESQNRSVVTIQGTGRVELDAKRRV